MSYALLTKGGHACALPDPSGFTPDDVIECTERITRNGRNVPCAKRYRLGTTFWRNKKRWFPEQYGW